MKLINALFNPLRCVFGLNWALEYSSRTSEIAENGYITWIKWTILEYNPIQEERPIFTVAWKEKLRQSPHK